MGLSQQTEVRRLNTLAGGMSGLFWLLDSGVTPAMLAAGIARQFVDSSGRYCKQELPGDGD
jgi:hypothetical protein